MSVKSTTKNYPPLSLYMNCCGFRSDSPFPFDFPAHQHIDTVAKLHIKVELDMQHTPAVSCTHLHPRNRENEQNLFFLPKESKELTLLHLRVCTHYIQRSFLQLSFFYNSVLICAARVKRPAVKSRSGLGFSPTRRERLFSSSSRVQPKDCCAFIVFLSCENDCRAAIISLRLFARPPA